MEFTTCESYGVMGLELKGMLNGFFPRVCAFYGCTLCRMRAITCITTMTDGVCGNSWGMNGNARDEMTKLASPSGAVSHRSFEQKLGMHHR